MVHDDTNGTRPLYTVMEDDNGEWHLHGYQRLEVNDGNSSMTSSHLDWDARIPPSQLPATSQLWKTCWWSTSRTSTSSDFDSSKDEESSWEKNDQNVHTERKKWIKMTKTHIIKMRVFVIGDMKNRYHQLMCHHGTIHKLRLQLINDQLARMAWVAPAPPARGYGCTGPAEGQCDVAISSFWGFFHRVLPIYL